jgi:outer membrane protein assembly factor BamB
MRKLVLTLAGACALLSQAADAATFYGPDATAYQINPAHDGVTRSYWGVSQPTKALWSIDLHGSVSYPLIADGRVFVTVGGAQGGGYGTQLVALNARTGAVLWGPIAIKGTYFWSNAAFERGKVFVLNYDGVLSSFDAATGAAGWSVKLPGQYAFSSAPTALNGTVYVGGAGSGGTVYAVDEATGAVKWTSGVANGDNSSPAVTSKGVFVSYSCPQVYDLSVSTGVATWQYAGPCSGGGGKTAVVHGNKLFVRDSVSEPKGYVFDAMNGTLLTRFSVDPAPAISDTRGYALNNGTLQGLDLATMSAQWSFAGDGSLVTAPIVVDNFVFVGSGSGKIFALQASTGKELWRIQGPAAINPPDEQNVSQPLTGLAAGGGVLMVPAGNTLSAYSISPWIK